MKLLKLDVAVSVSNWICKGTDYHIRKEHKNRYQVVCPCISSETVSKLPLNNEYLHIGRV